MIQRKQSLYWFLAAVLAITLIFMNFLQLVTNNGDYDITAFGVFKGTEKIVPAIPLIAYLVGLAVTNIVVIFLYKKRVLQARISTLLCLLSLGFYALLAFYRFMSLDSEVLATKFGYGIIIPLICAILDYMATRATISDEKKVRSLDRIR